MFQSVSQLFFFRDSPNSKRFNSTQITPSSTSNVLPLTKSTSISTNSHKNLSNFNQNDKNLRILNLSKNEKSQKSAKSEKSLKLLKAEKSLKGQKSFKDKMGRKGKRKMKMKSNVRNGIGGVEVENEMPKYLIGDDFYLVDPACENEEEEDLVCLRGGFTKDPLEMVGNAVGYRDEVKDLGLISKNEERIENKEVLKNDNVLERNDYTEIEAKVRKVVPQLSDKLVELYCWHYVTAEVNSTLESLILDEQGFTLFEQFLEEEQLDGRLNLNLNRLYFCGKVDLFEMELELARKFKKAKDLALKLWFTYLSPNSTMFIGNDFVNDIDLHEIADMIFSSENDFRDDVLDEFRMLKNEVFSYLNNFVFPTFVDFFVERLNEILTNPERALKVHPTQSNSNPVRPSLELKNKPSRPVSSLFQTDEFLLFFKKDNFSVLKTEGIFRIPGAKSKVDIILNYIDNQAKRPDTQKLKADIFIPLSTVLASLFNVKLISVHEVCSAFKEHIKRSLDVSSATTQQDREKVFSNVCTFLSELTAFDTITKMNARNLSQSFVMSMMFKGNEAPQEMLKKLGERQNLLMKLIMEKDVHVMPSLNNLTVNAEGCNETEYDLTVGANEFNPHISLQGQQVMRTPLLV